MQIWKHKQLSKNKHFELQIDKDDDWTNYFSHEFTWSRHRDHAGVNLRLEIGSFFFEIQVYDCRHWDYDNKCWEIYK